MLFSPGCVKLSIDNDALFQQQIDLSVEQNNPQVLTSRDGEKSLIPDTTTRIAL